MASSLRSKPCSRSPLRSNSRRSQNSWSAHDSPLIRINQIAQRNVRMASGSSRRSTFKSARWTAVRQRAGILLFYSQDLRHPRATPGHPGDVIERGRPGRQGTCQVPASSASRSIGSYSASTAHPAAQPIGRGFAQKPSSVEIVAHRAAEWAHFLASCLLVEIWPVGSTSSFQCCPRRLVTLSANLIASIRFDRDSGGDNFRQEDGAGLGWSKASPLAPSPRPVCLRAPNHVYTAPPVHRLRWYD